MALVVAFVNKSGLAEISDYNVDVYLNETLLFGGEVKGHERSKGWAALVKLFADSLTEKP